MDENKLKVLRELPYQVHKVCGLCKHGVFPQNDFGTCSRVQYEHKKHTGPARQLSIFRHGSCPHFELKDEATWTLGAYVEFLGV